MSLTKLQEKIRLFILDRPDIIIEKNLSEIIDHIGVGYSTFYTTLNKMGYKRFQDLKTAAIRKTLNNNKNIDTKNSTSTEVWDAWNEILEKNKKLFKEEIIDQFVNSLKSTHKVLFLGEGDSSMAADQWSLRMSELGVKVIFTTRDPYTTQNIVSEMNENSMIVFLSLMGAEGTSPKRYITWRNKHNKKIKFVSITSLPGSYIGKNADLTLTVHSTRLQPERNKWILTSIPYYILLDIVSRKIIGSRNVMDINRKWLEW